MLTLLNVTHSNVLPLKKHAPAIFTAILALLSSSNPALASPAVVNWPTYLRTGPGREFAVLQELARGAPVDVLGCTDRWCSIRLDRGTGYVEQANLGQPTPPPPPATAAAPCFDSQRAGYESGEAFRYCPR